MIIEHFLEMIIPYITGSLESIGVFIITIAALRGIFQFVKNGFDFKDDDVAIDFAKAMSLSCLLYTSSQATKYEPATWGDLPVLDNDKLSQEEKVRFESIELGIATLPQDILLEHRIPEMPADLVPIIEKIWIEEIPGEGE